MNVQSSDDMARPDNDSSTQFHEFVNEAVERLKSGEQIDVESYIRMQPQFAERFRQVWPSLSMLATMGSSCDVSAGMAPVFADIPYSGTVGMSDRTLGDFRIVREIGRGGMGVVYEAHQISLDRRVALKVLPFASMLDERQLQRFKNEARAAAGLHHANIVPIHSVGCERGVQYYAMQFIEGRTLAEVIRQLRREAGLDDPETPSPLTQCVDSGHSTAPLREDEAVSPAAILNPLAHSQRNVDSEVDNGKSNTQSKVARATQTWPPDHTWFKTVAQIGVQVAEALEYAHSMGVVHRDIKPANLIVDFRRQVWIADFGLAQIECDAALTMTGDILGTLRYMSPEQARGENRNIDHRADIYSLGATLYELLSLRPVIDGLRRESVLRQIENEDPLPLRSANLRTPVDLETIILKSLAKDRNERYEAAAELARDLKRFCEDVPIKARRASLLKRGARWSHRNRVLVRVLCAASILLALVIVLAAWRIHAETTARRFHQRLAEVGLQDAAEHRYVTAINIAGNNHERGDFGGAESALKELIPGPGERDLRGWEWRYLWSLMNSSARPFARHEGAAYCAHFSPDGRMLATCGTDGVRVWKWPSKEPLRHLKEATADVNGVAWSPNGEQLVAFGDDKHSRVYRTQDWKLQSDFVLGGPLVVGQFTFDGRMFVVGERKVVWDGVSIGENCLHLIDVESWQARRELRGPQATLQSVAVSHDGRFAAAASSDGHAYVYDLQTYEQKHRIGVDAHQECHAIAFAHHRPVLAVATNAIRLYDAESGMLIAQSSVVPHSTEGIAFGHNDKTLYTTGKSRQSTIWVESPSGQWVPASTYRCSEPLWSIAVHSDGDFVTTGVSGGLWARNRYVAEDRRRLPASLADVDAWLTPDHSSAGSEAFYEIDSARRAEMREDGTPSVIAASTWTNDNRLWVAQNFAHLTVWNSDVSRPLANHNFRASLGAGPELAICCDQRHLVTADNTRAITLFQHEPWSRLSTVVMPYHVRDMAISSDGRTLFIAAAVRLNTNGLSFDRAGAYCIVKALDIPTLKDASDRVPSGWRQPGLLCSMKSDDLAFLIKRLDLPEMGAMSEALRAYGHRVTTSGDGRVVVAHRNQDDTFHVWTSPDWNIRTRFTGVQKELNDFCLSPDGRTLAAIVANQKLQLWSTVTGRLLFSLEPHMLDCQKVTFSPDGRRLVVLGQGLNRASEIAVWSAADF